jgi:hypothetical protein
MLLVFVTVFAGVFLPASVVFLQGHGAGVAVSAMAGGFLVTWTALIATLRVRRRRGWWA